MFISNDYFQSIANGEIDGQLKADVCGLNIDIDSPVTAGEPIWYHFPVGASAFTAPTTARLHNIVSTAAADDGAPAGTGAWTVLVTGLDASYTIVEETVTMNGTTNVATTTAFTFIYELRVLTGGTGRTNAGNITAVAQTDLTLSCAMEAGLSRSSSSIFMVPAGYNCFVRGYSCAMANTNSNASTEVLLRYKPFGADTVWTEINTTMLSSTANTNSERVFSAPLKFEEKTMIQGFGKASTNNTRVQCSYTAILQSTT